MVRLIICPIFATTKNNGTLADRLGNGLQNRVEQFDSARYLKTKSSHSISDGCFSFSLCMRPAGIPARFSPHSWMLAVGLQTSKPFGNVFAGALQALKCKNIVPALHGDDKMAKILFPRRTVTIKWQKYRFRAARRR